MKNKQFKKIFKQERVVNFFMSIDDTNKLVKFYDGQLSSEIFPVGHITSVTIMEGAKEVKRSVVGRAIVGGVLAGSVGAVVGGLSAVSGSGKVKSIFGVKVIVSVADERRFNNFRKGSYTIHVCPGGKVTAEKYQNGLDRANEILDAIESLKIIS